MLICLKYNWYNDVSDINLHGHITCVFQGRWIFLEYGHFDKRFMYGIQKNCPARGILVFFLQNTLKTAFLNDNLNHRRTGARHFYPKSGYFLSIFKKGQRRPPPSSPSPLVARLYYTEIKFLLRWLPWLI